MKTIIHTYYFDSNQGDDYVNFADHLRQTNGKCFRSWGGQGSHYLGSEVDGREIELETNFLFNNQWNTTNDSPALPNRRVFDWAEDHLIPYTGVHMGHWLEITDEMRSIRDNTVKCGYCGHLEPASDKVFCDKCLDSQYLGEKDLHLLRLLPVSQDGEVRRAHLTVEERAGLYPRFKEAQIYGNSERGTRRRAKQREDILHKAEVAISNAADERDGMFWLLDKGLRIDNVIYYTHTSKFCFGWRKSITGGEREALVKELKGFRWDYEIK